MKYRRVGGARTFKSWKSWTKGDFVEGIFTGTSEDNYQKTNYHIEVKNYEFADGTDLPEGKQLGLNSNGSLDYQFQDIAEGSQVMVEYEGKGMLEKGLYKGKEFHQVSVSVADGEDSVKEESESDESGL